ncbi:ATP-binding protein [Streptomyces sp. NBC_01255]|uniref:NACHT domain-containing protein n=1 Tax=Streptomyces sp. NBC_01255 TaxID=2903798 RepID=UPI002E354999|nr:ATP-binding protein [Streptomyces sp. NBC_01255]
MAVGYADHVTYNVLPPGSRDAARRGDAQLNSYLYTASRIADHHPYPGLVEGPGPLPLAEIYVRQLAQGQRDAEDQDDTDTRGADVASVPVPAETIFTGGGRVRVVLAGAGGGKSALLRHHLATGAGHWLVHGKGDRVHASMPVLVRATTLADSPLLTQGLAQAVVDELGPYGLRETLTSEFFSRPPHPQVPWLVMVDGLDEVPDRTTRVTLMNRLAREADDESSPYRFIVATRPLPGGELDRLGPGAEHFELQPFSPADVWAYARGYFRDLPDSERQVRIFTAGLKESGLDGLARTPLIAFILCQLYTADPTRPLPEGRTGAYQSFVELLYEQNTHKSIRHTHDEVIRALKDRHQIPRDQQAAEQAAQLVREGLPELIDHVAYERINGNTAPAVEILSLRLDVQRPAKVKPPLWNAFLGDLLRPTGLLAEHSGDFHFLHQTLLEYHAARHATRDEQARAALLHELFLRNRAYADHDLQPRRPIQPSHLSFLLDGLLAPADHIATQTIRVLDDLSTSGHPTACKLLVKLVELRTKLPPDSTARQLAAHARHQSLSTNRVLAARTLATVSGHQDEGATLLAGFVGDTSLPFRDRVSAATLLATVDGHRSQAAQLLLDLAGDRTLSFEFRVAAGYGLASLKERRDEIVQLFAPWADSVTLHIKDRTTAASLLAAAGDERANQLLFRVANDSSLDIRIRVHAARGLAQIGDERIATVLIALAEVNDPEGDIHGHVRAAEVLSFLPRYRGTAAGALTRIATDSAHWDGLARVEAAEYLAWLDGYRAHGTDLLTRLAEGGRSRDHATRALAKLRTGRRPTWR